MRAGARASSALACVVAMALLAAACGRTPDDKVSRWAAEVLPAPAPEVALEVAAPAEPEAAASEAEGPDAVDELAMAPCERLLYRACQGLGPDGEECAEARRAFPADRTPEWEMGCQAVLDRHQDLIDAGGEPARGSGRNACRLLQERLCAESGVNTWACREARDDANRLRRQRRTASCLGDLLLREQAAVFSAKPPESGK
jgi:hypothetical protein